MELKNRGFIETPSKMIEKKYHPWLEDVYPNMELLGKTFFSIVKDEKEYPKKLFLAGEKASYPFFTDESPYNLRKLGINFDPLKVGEIEYFSPCPKDLKSGLRNPYKEAFWEKCLDLGHCPYSSKCPGVGKNQLLDYIAEKAKTPGYKLTTGEENKILFGEVDSD